MTSDTVESIDSEARDAASDIVEEFSEQIELDEDEVAQTIQQQADEYTMPIDEARRTVRNSLLNRDDVDESEITDNNGSEPVDDEPTPVDEISQDDVDSAVTVEVKPTSIADYETDTVAQLGDLADETGGISFISFHSSDTPELEEGQSVRLSPVFVDTYEGDLQVKINGSTEASELSDDIEADTDASYSGRGGERTLTAPIVDIGPDSGLIKLCPVEDEEGEMCGRVVSGDSNGRCKKHGEVDGVHDLRIKAILDAGDMAVTAYFGREQTVALTGIDLSEAKEIAAEEYNMEAVIEKMAPDLIGRYITVTGTEFELNHGGVGISVDSYDTDTASEVRVDNPEDMIVSTRSLQASTVGSSGEESGETQRPSVDDAFPDGPTVQQADGREPARRVFPSELADAGHTFKLSDEERAPNYALLPTGERANRVFIVGTLTEVEDVGTDSEYLRGRVVGPDGTAFVYAGQYQPEPASFLRQAKGDTPMFVAVTGKPKSYETDNGDVNVKLNPEVISEVDRDTREQWVSETAEQTLARIEAFDPEDDYVDCMAANEYDTPPGDYAESVAAGMEELKNNE